MTLVRTAYGKPWSRLLHDVGVSKELLEAVGKLILKNVVAEARKDLSRQGNRPTPRGMAEGIPNSEKFFDSFDWQVSGTSSVEITSSWPWITQILEGRKEFKMKWLMQPQRKVAKMKIGPKTTILRTTPVSKNQSGAWIHPGFGRMGEENKPHHFVDRGFRKAKKSIDKEVKRQILKAVKRGQVDFFG